MLPNFSINKIPNFTINTQFHNKYPISLLLISVIGNINCIYGNRHTKSFPIPGACPEIRRDWKEMTSISHISVSDFKKPVYFKGSASPCYDLNLIGRI